MQSQYCRHLTAQPSQGSKIEKAAVEIMDVKDVGTVGRQRQQTPRTRKIEIFATQFVFQPPHGFRDHATCKLRQTADDTSLTVCTGCAARRYDCPSRFPDSWVVIVCQQDYSLEG